MSLGLALKLANATLFKGGGGVTFRDKLAVRPPSLTAAGAATFDGWFGRSADFVTVFGSHSNWLAFFIAIDEVITGFAGDPRPKIWALGPNVVGTTLAEAAAGDFDAYYTDAAELILADAPASGPILVRVGHEFNLADNYPWEVITSGASEAYKGAFRRFVDRFRAVSSRFRFIWNPNFISTGAGGPSYDVTQCYPGNSYVDVIGNDIYYNSASTAGPDVYFEYSRDLPGFGLQAQADLAALYGKPMAMCEFGLNWDRPRWVDRMWQWMADKRFAYAGYFDANPDYNWQLSGGAYPDSGARFKADFRDGGPIPLYNDTFVISQESWAIQSAGALSVVSETLRITNGGNYVNGGLKTWTGLTIGATYTVRLDVNTGGKAAQLNVSQGGSPFTVASSQTYNNASLETKTFSFVATQTLMRLQVVPYAGDAAQVVTLDNVKLFAGSTGN